MVLGTFTQSLVGLGTHERLECLQGEKQEQAYTVAGLGLQPVSFHAKKKVIPMCRAPEMCAQGRDPACPGLGILWNLAPAAPGHSLQDALLAQAGPPMGYLSRVCFLLDQVAFLTLNQFLIMLYAYYPSYFQNCCYKRCVLNWTLSFTDLAATTDYFLIALSWKWSFYVKTWAVKTWVNIKEDLQSSYED